MKIALTPPGKKPVLCRHCNRPRGDHRARTLECPDGRRTRIGWTDYGPERFEPREAPR